MDRSTPKQWCWELQQHGSGPDWRFWAMIHPVRVGVFEQLVYHYLGHSAFQHTEEDRYCPDHQQICRQQSYIDQRSHQKRMEMTETRENIWIYNQISVHQNIIAIERGYAGWPEPYTDLETGLLRDIFAQPEITLKQWLIMGYGDGYQSQIVRSGTGFADLQSYLT